MFAITIYILMGCWAVYSSYLIFRVWQQKSIQEVNSYLLGSIPSVFTTLGVLGTFLGIWLGLQQFAVKDITGSIPTLLEGLKSAFGTSIAGIFLSLLFGRAIDVALRRTEKDGLPEPTGEFAVLVEIRDHLKALADGSQKSSNQFLDALQGDREDSLKKQLIRIEQQNGKSLTISGNMEKVMHDLANALGATRETCILDEVRELRAEKKEAESKMKQNLEGLKEFMVGNRKFLGEKFREFSELLAKNNTEALVVVMRSATEQFNAQMSALIEKLVQENFKELNKSVEQMNTWQKENKEMVQTLTDQFKKVSEDFALSADSIESITAQTQELTARDGALVKLIGELQRVMVDDKKFEEISEKINVTVDTLKRNTEAFDNTTNKLNSWVRHQRSFSDSVDKLLIRLEEIDKIKDINSVFWNNTKLQLNEAVGIINQASTTLNQDLENINAEFYERLNNTLTNLDTLIQRVILNYNN